MDKKEAIQKYIDWSLAKPEFQEDLKYATKLAINIWAETGKFPDPKDLVINHDAETFERRIQFVSKNES